MKRAVLAGVDSIEHGTYMTDEIMALMKQQGHVLGADNQCRQFRRGEIEDRRLFSGHRRPKAAAIGPVIQATFAKAYKPA